MTLQDHLILLHAEAEGLKARIAYIEAAIKPSEPANKLAAVPGPTPEDIKAAVRPTQEDIKPNVVQLFSPIVKVFDLETAERDELIEKMKEIDPAWEPEKGERRATIREKLRSLLAQNSVGQLRACPTPLEETPDKVPLAPVAEAPQALEVVEQSSSLPFPHGMRNHVPPGIIYDALDKAVEFHDFIRKHATAPQVITHLAVLGCDAECCRHGEERPGACPKILECHASFDK